MASFRVPLFSVKSHEVILYSTQMKTQIEFLILDAKNNKDEKEIWTLITNFEIFVAQ